jgi:N-methylhydantoinase A
VTYRLGVDVGGTFTDLVLVGPDGVARTCKVLSSAGNYADAIIQGARELLRETGAAAGDIREIIHGTTVATNAILERRGAATGLITTEGFRDLLEIGRLRLARLYDLNFERPCRCRRAWATRWPRSSRRPSGGSTSGRTGIARTTIPSSS